MACFTNNLPMSASYLISLLSTLLFFSPMPFQKTSPKEVVLETQEELVLVGQFNLYIDANYYKDTGLILLTWGTKIDKVVYKNDCQALFDLITFREEICTFDEVQGIKRLLDLYNNAKLDTTNINKI